MAVNTVLAHRSAGVDVAAVEVQDTEIDAPPAQLVEEADHTTASLSESSLSAILGSEGPLVRPCPFSFQISVFASNESAYGFWTVLI
jgi:hypothetical protein